MKTDDALKFPGASTDESSKTDASVTAAGTSGSGLGPGLGDQSAQSRSRPSGGEAIDAARVAEIKLAISEGRFRVNPVAVAHRLLKRVQELIAVYRH